MAISVVSFLFSWCSTGSLGAHSASFLYCILSPTGLVPKLHRGSWGPLLLCGGFPYHISLQLIWSPTHWLPVFTELYNSSIAHLISPHNLPSEMCHFCCLWDGMFDYHRAEITVMQFRGHSLHQSMSVSWAVTLSHFVSQIRLHDFFRLLAIGMCHFPPVHHFGMACSARSKVNIQHY